MADRHQPDVYIVAGPNGAGKSTFARLFLPDYADCKEFVNADLIAAGLSPFNPEGQAIQAGRLMLSRIASLARSQTSFGFETTLAGRSWLPLLEDLRKQGYRINLFFLWLPSPELAIERVQDRVCAGGHSVPEDVIRRRYARGLKNLFQNYRYCVDSYQVFDNSGKEPRMLALFDRGVEFIVDPKLYSHREGGDMIGPYDEKDLPLWALKADEALKKAVKAAIEEHWKAGRPVHIWRDGQTVALHADGSCRPVSPSDLPFTSPLSRR